MKSSKKNTNLPISVLNLPPKNTFIEAPSSSSDYRLYHVAGKKICVEAYKIQLQKTKLFTNLQIYQWRHQTQFPIVKTKYVSVQSKHCQSPNLIELIVFNEHCPLKINRIYQMTLAQTLYMLKQAIIGFERLYNRFGAFEIMESMIGINEKGCCRVWINQNFSVNVIAKPESSQQKMVNSIHQIMEKHCQQSKTIKKLFAKLRYTKSFLGSLKQIDSFVVCSKVLVPTRHILNSSVRQVSMRFDTFNPFTQHKAAVNERVSQPNMRCSIKSSRIQKKNSKEEPSQMDTAKFGYIPNEIKRFKSQDQIRIANIMKISDGETAYTRNIKCSNTGYYNSPRGIRTQKNISGNSKNQGSKWLEESSFIIELDDEKDQNKKDKRQLSFSEAVINLNLSSDKEIANKNRRFSANINTANKYFYKFNNSIKKSQYESYAQEFTPILQTNVLSSSSPRNKITEEEEQQKCREEHMDNIMKNNGWNGLTGVMNVQKQMKQSFHEGKQQISHKKQVKLEKLQKIGRRPVAMSIQPQQYEGII